MSTTLLHQTPRMILQNLFVLDYVTEQPGGRLRKALRQFRVVTLEVMQNRSTSTVYRIRQTGIVYQQFRETETIYPTFEDFLIYKQEDELLQQYKQKPCVYIVEKDNLIRRVKTPRFTAIYDRKFNLSNIEWVDTPPKELTANEKIKNAFQFLRAHL